MACSTRNGGCGRFVLGSTHCLAMKAIICFLLLSIIFLRCSVVSCIVPFFRIVSATFSGSVVPNALRRASSETLVPLFASENMVSVAKASVIASIFPIRYCNAFSGFTRTSKCPLSFVKRAIVYFSPIPISLA